MAIRDISLVSRGQPLARVINQDVPLVYLSIEVNCAIEVHIVGSSRIVCIVAVKRKLLAFLKLDLKSLQIFDSSLLFDVISAI